MAMKSGRGVVGYSTLLIPSTTTTAIGTITGGTDAAGLTWVMKGLSPYDTLQAVLDVSAAATAAGDTADFYIDTTVDGSNWVNIVHFPQILGNGGAKRYTAVVSPPASVTATATDVTSDAAANAVRHVLGDQIRVRLTTANATTVDNSVTWSMAIKVL